jgi:hypothetical protein
MSGIRLWRCSRCCEQMAVVAVDATRLFCGECFYRQTVERVMAEAFAPAPEQITAAAPMRSAPAADQAYLPH